MQSSQDAVSSEGGTQSQSKETGRKSKRAPQELYVPRGRRQQAVDRPEGVSSEASQQPRKNEKRKGRESGKVKPQRDRKISTDGEEGEDNSAKEKKSQNRGRHGKRVEQQRYVPKPQREDAKARKSSDEAITLPAGESQNVSRVGNSSAKKQVSQTVESCKNASPVPEDWNEIDCDDKEVTCHPTGTRLTAHGRLVPVGPGDATLQEAAPNEMEVKTQEIKSQSEDGMRLQEPEDNPKAQIVSNLTKVSCTEEDNWDTTMSNNSEAKVASHTVESEETTKFQDASAGRKSNSKELKEDVLASDTSEAMETICKTNEDTASLAEKSSVTMTTDEVSQRQDTDAGVSTNTDAVGSLSLNHKLPGGETCLASNAPSRNDVDLTGMQQTSEASSTNLLPGDTDLSETVQGNKQLDLVTDEEDDASTRCNEEAVAVETPPEVEKSNDAGNEDDDDAEEGDDWDAMFDESGDCLKQEEMQELSEGVGNVEVSVKQSKRDYYNYQPKDNMNYSELEHVIEVFDFPPDFKTHDLITGFCNMKTKEMDIKWIDDTHALAIFPSSIIAQDALSISNPMFRTRPLLLASREAKVKAKQSVEFLNPPSKPRPETSAATARRLVSGALGLKTNESKEQRAAERQKLKEAKDRRRNDKRQQEDIWSGNI
ncbi:coiled-coil domain-containing protein R3HCC1L-like isoform X2 [Patiria miniata]|nr:coiled-coil domain-containing protein R3HCC1L-like isoform X2 [Patiria miniata]